MSFFQRAFLLLIFSILCTVAIQAQSNKPTAPARPRGASETKAVGTPDEIEGALRKMGGSHSPAPLLSFKVSNAQPNLSASERSYQRARQVLETGIEALGGMEAIDAIKSFTIFEQQTRYDAFRNPTPAPPYDNYDVVEKLAVDFSKSRLAYEINQVQPHFVWRPLTIINGGEGYQAERWARWATRIQSPSLLNYRYLFQKLPQFLLRDALTERAASLRWLGHGETGGRQQEIITFVDGNNRQMALYFDARTRLLDRYEYLYADPIAGDTSSVFVYEGYRNLGRLKVPTGLINRVGRHAANRIRYEIEINPVLDDSRFALTESLSVVKPAAPRPAYTMTPIAPDVYVVENVANSFYNVLVVAFDKFILVAEAPEQVPQAGLSERVIAKIKETIPGKPIRYLTFSHHHVDHAGGARAYIAEGATIITTPGNRKFVESLASARFTLKPDDLARAPRRPLIDLVTNGKHVIRDDHHVVELYDIGPYWHAKEELLVYLPREKLLFEGDLFTSGFGDEVGPAKDSTFLLAEKIKKLGLDVQQIIGVHGRLRPIGDLNKAIERRNRMSAQGDAPAAASSVTVREFCTNVGPVTLSFDGAIVTGRYRLTVTPQPQDGTIKGDFKEGLVSAVWTDPDGTGRIIFGFAADFEQFTAMFNNQKNPNHWYGPWTGVSTTTPNEALAKRRRSLHCEWK